MTNSTKENNSEASMEKKVLETIEKNRLKPLSRWYFIAQSSALGIGLVVVALLILFFASLILFNLRENRTYMAPGFGFYGFGVFFLSLPWLLIALVAGLLILLEYILRRYKFTYQRPILYSFVAMALLVSVGSIFISQSKMHESLMAKSRLKPKFFGSPIYRRLGLPKTDQLTIGKVFETNAQGCRLNTKGGESWQVYINDETHLPHDYSISNGDIIMVIGPKSENSIKAVGVKPLPGLPMRK
ncbi:MAG: hypothetical protein JNN11_03725 [Candidatus Doudnabacteria bacterium]|nr:hypothetical protein [Candidatus Doudnabacteria bacterium]